MGGYAVYGEAVQSPIYNTPALAGSSLLRVMIALITVHLLGAYAIVLNPTERALETALQVDERRGAWLWRMCLRTLFVLFTYGVSVLCRDSFPPLLELVSSFTSAPTMFLCPCAFYVKLSYLVGRPVSFSRRSTFAAAGPPRIQNSGLGIMPFLGRSIKRRALDFSSTCCCMPGGRISSALSSCTACKEGHSTTAKRVPQFSMALAAT